MVLMPTALGQRQCVQRLIFSGLVATLRPAITTPPTLAWVAALGYVRQMSWQLTRQRTQAVEQMCTMHGAPAKAVAKAAE